MCQKSNWNGDQISIVNTAIQKWDTWVAYSNDCPIVILKSYWPDVSRNINIFLDYELILFPGSSLMHSSQWGMAASSGQFSLIHYTLKLGHLWRGLWRKYLRCGLLTGWRNFLVLETVLYLKWPRGLLIHIGSFDSASLLLNNLIFIYLISVISMLRLACSAFFLRQPCSLCFCIPLPQVTLTCPDLNWWLAVSATCIVQLKLFISYHKVFRCFTKD